VTRRLCSAVLTFEAVLMLLSILVLNGFSVLAPAAAASVGGGMAALCLVAAGGLGRPRGYLLGHLVQIAVVALGLLAPVLAVVGFLFAALWIAAYVLGLRIDRDRALA
jgi:uncharacterized protein DUF4233